MHPNSKNPWRKRAHVGLTLLMATVLAVSFTPAASAKKAPLEVDARVEVGLLCPLDLDARVRADGGVLLTFDPRGDVDGTRVYRAEGNGELVEVAELEPGAKSYVDEGVGPGTFVYEVRALVDVDLLLACPQVIVTVPGEGGGEHPRCPTGIVAVVHANGTVLLNLEAALNASATVLQRSAAGGEPAHLTSLDAGVTAFLDVDVLLGTAYTYLVLVEVGADLLLCLVVDVTVPGETESPCPSILRAILKADGSILLLFDAALDVEAATLLRADGTGEPEPVAELTAGATAFLDVDALLGLKVRYLLLVVVGGVELLCPGPEVEVPDEPCPTDLEAQAEGDGDVRLTFRPHPDADAHHVYRAEGDADPVLVAELGPEATEFLDEEAVPGTTYRYEVRSVFNGTEAEGCPMVEVTAIPVFPSAAVGVVASLAGVAAYAGLRRRP